MGTTCCKKRDQNDDQDQTAAQTNEDCYFYDDKGNCYMWDDTAKEGFTCMNTKRHFTQDQLKSFAYWDDENPEIVLDISAVLAQQENQKQQTREEQYVEESALGEHLQWQESADAGDEVWTIDSEQHQSQQTGYGTAFSGNEEGGRQYGYQYESQNKPISSYIKSSTNKQQWGKDGEYKEQQTEENYTNYDASLLHPTANRKATNFRRAYGRTRADASGRGRGRLQRLYGRERSKQSPIGRRGPPRGTVSISRVPGRRATKRGFSGSRCLRPGSPPRRRCPPPPPLPSPDRWRSRGGEKSPKARLKMKDPELHGKYLDIFRL